MHRHISDSTLPFPFNPAPLGTMQKDILLQRGTVSMPTSPISRSREVGSWSWDAAAPAPHSAGADNMQSQENSFAPFGQMQDAPSDEHPHDTFSPSTSPLLSEQYSTSNIPGSSAYHNHPYPSTPFPAPFSTSHPGPGSGTSAYPSAHLVPYGAHEDVGDHVGGHGPPRKKRAQVRIACTHCQKACKKCSNTRPCERCVQYGLKDCVDSTRKPRKTGIKRGPYKRRTSKYALSPSSSASPHPYGESSISASYAEEQERPAGAWWDPQPQLPYHDQPPHQHHQRVSDPFAFGPPPQTHAQAYAPSHIPPPRAPSLHSAFSAALGSLTSTSGGARWIHGQRVSGTDGDGPREHELAGRPQGAHPSGGAFPLSLSLHHSADPFSRAVSPIRQFLPSATGAGGGLGAPPPVDPGASFGQYSRPEGDVSPTDTQNVFLPGPRPDLGDIEMNPNSSSLPSPSLTGSASVSASATPPNNDLETTAPSAPAASSWLNTSALPWDAQIVSCPTSPRIASTPLWADGARLPRSSSAEPPEVPSLLSSHPLHQSQQGVIGAGPSGNGGPGGLGGLSGVGGSGWNRFSGGSIHSPALIALKKIRKPSLRTLMSPLSSAGVSRAGSPTFSGMGIGLGLGMGPGIAGDVGGAQEAEQSPTLFDQPMALDDVPPLAWDLPDGGASGGGVGAGAGDGMGTMLMEPSRDVHGPPAEGLGLMGLEGVFQR